MDHDAIRFNHAACELLADALQQFSLAHRPQLTSTAQGGRRDVVEASPLLGRTSASPTSDIDSPLLSTGIARLMDMCLSASSSHCPRRMTAGIVPASDFFHVGRGVFLLSHGRTWSYAGDAWCDSSVQSSGQRFRPGRIFESSQTAAVLGREDVLKGVSWHSTVVTTLK